MSRCGLDHRADAFAPIWVGQSDHGRVLHRRQRVEHILDFLGRDVLAFADDDVLDAPGQRHMAVGMGHSEVSGAEPALVVERLDVEARVGVTHEQHWPLDTDFAFDPMLCNGAVGGHDRHFAPSDRSALGVGELFVGVRRRTLADHRAFGHAVAVRDRYAHLLFDFEEDLRGFGGAAAGHGPQERHGSAAELLIPGQEHLVEGSRPADDRRSVLGVCRHRPRGGELLDQDRSEAVCQQHHDEVRAADMSVREGDGAHVVSVGLQRQCEPGSRRHQGLVGVLDSFRIRCGARGVVDPAHGGAIVRRWWQIAGVAFGEIRISVEDLRTGVKISAYFGCHRVVVEIAPDSRGEDEARSCLSDAEPDLSVPVDVNDRVLDGAEPRQSKTQDDCLYPCGQLPCDRGAFGYSQAVQACRNSLSLVAELAISELPAGVVDQEQPVRRKRSPAFEQFPERRGIENLFGHFASHRRSS